MPSPEDTGSSGPHSENHHLDDPLEDYLLAKSKTGGTGNYRRNAERVVHDWIDFTDQHRDVQTFDGLDPAALESYALYLTRRVNGGGIAASTARKYCDYVRAYLGWCVSREYATDNPAATDRVEDALPDDDQRSEHRQQLWPPEQRRAIVEYVDRRARNAIDERGLDLGSQSPCRGAGRGIDCPVVSTRISRRGQPGSLLRKEVVTRRCRSGTIWTSVRDGRRGRRRCGTSCKRNLQGYLVGIFETATWIAIERLKGDTRRNTA